MADLKHTHEQGGECLACDIVSLRSMRQACEAYRAAAFGVYTERALLINEAELAALDRVEAALAERERLLYLAEQRRLKLLEWRPKADVCCACGVHRSAHYPSGEAVYADMDSLCEKFEPYGLLASEAERIEAERVRKAKEKS